VGPLCLADSLQLGEIRLIRHQFAERSRMRLYGPRRVPIGASAEGIRILQLEEIGDVLEDTGDLDVLH
jgi:hypothetical protein